MSKTILLLTFICLFILFMGGLFFPDNAAMWLASSSIGFAFIRLAMMAVVGVLLITDPPRNVYLRAVVMVFSAVLATWSLSATYQNDMKFLDSLSLLEMSVASGLIALELPVNTDTDLSVQSSPAVPKL